MLELKALHQEIIDEIGIQTLARFGLNIFSLNTYDAYGASAISTNIVSDSYNRHKNNKQGFGQYFEDLDVGQKNITSKLFNKGEKTYTTDELADIKKVADILNSDKKKENLNSKDKTKFDFVMLNFKDEVESINTNQNMLNNANKNDTSTDTVTFDSNGNVVQRSQHKVIKNTKDLLKDRYLKNNDVLTMPFDDYKKHKENLEGMANNPKIKLEQKEKAQKALTMLNKNNVTNRLMCENPKTTAVITQSITASGHIVQAGLSDAIVVVLSTLANGAIWEIKDAFSDKGSDTPINTRIKRLLKKVLENFYKTFKRGASFGAIDIGVGILSQIFKSISSKLKDLWDTIRTSSKSIYNAIYSYTTGEIKSYKEVISSVIKGLLSAVMVVGTIVLESKLEAFLATIVTPIVASFLAPALSIVIASIAVVLMSKSVDLALNILFGIFAQRDIVKMKAEKIRELSEELFPLLVKEREELKELIERAYRERKLSFEKSFDEFKEGLSTKNIDDVICGLIGINHMYSKKLQFKTQKEFDNFMESKCELII
ncbi:MAG: Unknown protein [uncultured Campylobacterales bacterium]|uniref:Uncharacterized protein n=1 Tax=uncultured Campylobacterales bacterium TaxID=352960 RepID=A0A6S6TLR6_9BACT|nr:MAG: Unknown protein [uncultured Campylobacterales bacterium]